MYGEVMKVVSKKLKTRKDHKCIRCESVIDKGDYAVMTKTYPSNNGDVYRGPVSILSNYACMKCINEVFNEAPNQ